MWITLKDWKKYSQIFHKWLPQTKSVGICKWTGYNE